MLITTTNLTILSPLTVTLLCLLTELTMADQGLLRLGQIGPLVCTPGQYATVQYTAFAS